MDTKKHMCLGVITKAQGIKGEVKVKTYTDNPDVLRNLDYVIIENKRYEIEKSRSDSTAVYLLLENIDDRNKAETMRSKEIFIETQFAPKPPEGRVYIQDLISSKVYDDGGEYLGELSEILINTANDVYVIKNRGKEILVPVIKSVVSSIDSDNKKIILIADRLKEVAVYDD